MKLEEKAGNAQSSQNPLAMSHTSRDLKLKEWRCNVFSLTERDELPLFKRKKRSGSTGLSNSFDSLGSMLQASDKKNAPPANQEKQGNVLADFSSLVLSRGLKRQGSVDSRNVNLRTLS